MRLPNVRRISLISSIASLIGCTQLHNDDPIVVESCHNYTVYIEDSYSSQRMQMIEDGANKWASYTNNLTLHFNSASRDTLKAIQYKPGTIVVFNEASPNKDDLAWTAWESEWAYIILPANIKPNKLFRATVMHEFGHAFHLLHEPEHPNAVMSDGYFINCDDLNQFCDKWECKEPLICGE